MNRDPNPIDDDSSVEDKSLLDRVEEALVGTHQADPSGGENQAGDIDNIDNNNENPIISSAAKM